MYKYLIIVLLTFTLSVAAKPKSSLFPVTMKDMGTIKAGTEQVTVEFDIQNMTGKTVTISRVHASCGCMDIDYPRQPIKAQNKGKVKVVINLNNQYGYFKKSVLIYATNARPTILRITGKVI